MDGLAVLDAKNRIVCVYRYFSKLLVSFGSMEELAMGAPDELR